MRQTLILVTLFSEKKESLTFGLAFILSTSDFIVIPFNVSLSLVRWAEFKTFI
jgi:hypothetical protein